MLAAEYACSKRRRREWPPRSRRAHAPHLPKPAQPASTSTHPVFFLFLFFFSLLWDAHEHAWWGETQQRKTHTYTHRHTHTEKSGRRRGAAFLVGRSSHPAFSGCGSCPQLLPILQLSHARLSAAADPTPPSRTHLCQLLRTF